MSNLKHQLPKHPSQPIKIIKGKGEVSYRLVKEFKRVPLNKDNLKNMLVYWVVVWSSNQTTGGATIVSKPVFEKRRIYVRDDGSIRTYKQVGLNYDDLFYVIENREQIAKALMED